MILVYTGLPGSGKTTKMAQLALSKLQNAEKLYKKHNYLRKVYTNIKFSQQIEDKYSQFIHYFDDIHTMPDWRDCDIFIDELAIYFDSREWERLPRKIKKFLRLHRHYNVNIYGIAQDFLTIDNALRRLTSELFYMHRFVGTREPSPSRPPQKYPFIMGFQCGVEKQLWELEKEHYKYYSRTFYWHTKKEFNIFDTTQELPDQNLPPLIKQVRICLEDGYKQTRYI